VKTRSLTRRLDILVAGDLNADVVLAGSEWPEPRQERMVREGRITLGSSAGIFAANAARLGLRVALVARVGRDRLGDAMLDELATAGVQIELVRRESRQATGFTVVINAEGKPDKAMLTFSGAMAELRAADIAPAVERARHLHIASYFLVPKLWDALPALLRRARSAGISSSIDPNPDPAQKYDSGLAAALKYADYFLPNEFEAQRVTSAQSLEDALAALPSFCRASVVKAGAKGAWYISENAREHVAAAPVQVVDTTGAGDSFDVGFIWSCVHNLSVQQCLVAGSVCAALACSAAGGTTAFAQPRKLKALRRALNSLQRS
jgi:sugar/nucleoside kinase (ribokinase family)